MALVELKVAGFGLLGVIVGAYITSCSSEKVAMAQIQSQQKLAATEIALKLIEYRSAPMAEIYAANSKMQSSSYKEVNGAAKELSVAAAVAAARLGGETGDVCRELSSMASLYAITPMEDFEEIKSDQAGKLGAKVAEVMISFNKSQKSLFESVIPAQPKK